LQGFNLKLENKYQSNNILYHYIDRIVYFEHFTNINDAILREKRIKKWKREYKNNLIVTLNPEWKDLYDEICE